MTFKIAWNGMKTVSSMFVLCMFHVDFVWICLNSFYDSAFNKLLVVKSRSGVWESWSIYQFGSKCPKQGNRVPHPFLRKFLFYLNIFTILSWFCIEQALVGEIWIRYLRVTANLPFLDHNTPNKEIWCHTLFSEKLIYHKAFMTFSWFNIQQALDWGNQIKCFRVS